MGIPECQNALMNVVNVVASLRRVRRSTTVGLRSLHILVHFLDLHVLFISGQDYNARSLELPLRKAESTSISLRANLIFTCN
jgi:hypothetical protein